MSEEREKRKKEKENNRLRGKTSQKSQNNGLKQIIDQKVIYLHLFIYIEREYHE